MPPHDVHQAFVDWGTDRIQGERERALFRRMAERSGIRHRWSVLPPTQGGGSPVAHCGLYRGDRPSTTPPLSPPPGGDGTDRVVLPLFIDLKFRVEYRV